MNCSLCPVVAFYMKGAFHLTKISGNSGSKWNGTNFREICFENLSSPLEVVLLSGSLEIREITCFICHFYPVRIGPSSFIVVRVSYKMAASLSSRHYTGCKMICHSFSLFSIKNENIRI